MNRYDWNSAAVLYSPRKGCMSLDGRLAQMLPRSTWPLRNWAGIRLPKSGEMRRPSELEGH